MTGPVFMRRGASWTHRRREDDEPGGFAHSICGLSFAPGHGLAGAAMVIEMSDDQPITCPSCQAEEMAAERDRMMAALPAASFHPKPSAQDAQAWMGPRVEALVSIDPIGRVEVTAFLDGIEVPYAHLKVAVVNPGEGAVREEWDHETREVSSDDTMTSPFRSLVLQDRNYALRRYGHLIHDEPALKDV